MIRFVFLFLLLFVLLAASAPAEEQGPVSGCSWQAGLQKIGVSCGDATEYSGLVISCEQLPLTLWWIGEDCGGMDRCPVVLEIDGKAISLGEGKYSYDGYSGVLVSLTHRREILALLKNAKYLRARVGAKTSVDLPVQGLSQSVDMLIAACAAG
jgi:hypothetical protein